MSIEALRAFVNSHPELAPTNAEVLLWISRKAGLAEPDRNKDVEVEAARILTELRALYGS